MPSGVLQGSNTSFAQTASTSLKQTISSFSDFGQTHDFIMQNVHFLPLEKQREWNTVKGQMDTILQQSAAANAAVAAVAKVQPPPPPPPRLISFFSVVQESHN